MYACIFLSGLNANHTVVATGWVQILEQSAGSQGDGVIMRRVATASEPATHTFNADVNCNLRISISAFRGADTTSTPKTASEGHFVSGGATTDTLPSIADVAAGSMLLSSWGARWSAGSGTFSSPPAGTDVYSASGNAADQSSSTLRAYTIDTMLESGLTAGATGTRTGSWSSSSGTSGVVGVVVEPASSGPTSPTTGQLHPRGWKNTFAPASGQLLPRRVIT